MREKERWDALIDPVFYAEQSADMFTIKAVLVRDPSRDIRVQISDDQRQTARWLAQALLEWAGEGE